jgi:intein/homing endonuclease
MFLMVLKEKILSAEEQRAYLAGYFDAEGFFP